MANRTKRTAKTCAKFIGLLRATANVSRACEELNIGRRTAYEWRDEDEGFAALWDEAIEAAIDDLEEEARRRAFKGLVKKKFDRKGEPILDPATGEQYYEREYSDALMVVLLKAHRPAKYRERFEHSGEIKTQIPTLNVILNGNSNGNSTD